MDREKVIKALECTHKDGIECQNCPYWKEDDCAETLNEDVLALLKEQEETINDLTDTIRQLNQHIKDLSEYMTPYGKVNDIKACAELLKEQDNEKKRVMKVIWDTLHEGLSIDTVVDQDWVYEVIRHRIEDT